MTSDGVCLMGRKSNQIPFPTEVRAYTIPIPPLYNWLLFETLYYFKIQNEREIETFRVASAWVASVKEAFQGVPTTPGSNHHVSAQNLEW